MKNNQRRIPFLCLSLLVILLAACTPAAPQTATPESTLPPTSTPEHTIEPTGTEVVAATVAPSPTVTPDLRLKPEEWQEWPILPELSPAMQAVFEQGQAMERDPHVFSVLGDCQSAPTYFLAMYDENRYTLTEDQEGLQETIDWYAGSFAHRSVTVENGLNAASALNPLWAMTHEECESTETPVACEIRLSNPSLMLVSLGTNWLPSASYEDYLSYLNQIVDIILEAGVIPVLSTKADNGEGDYNRNLAMAQVAYDRQLPLWNFWAAVKDLQNFGLDKDRHNVYLNYQGWDIRNISGLELLDTVRRQLELQ
jgi:hypothetical protein